MAELRFDDRVAIVTGAGGGLGRAYALLLGSRGAKVVVNDLGGNAKGEGSGRAADVVVDEIRKAGGTACANYDSVEDGEKVVQTALDNYGRVDILINNAGILRDRSFARISDTDWDLIHRVHLRGSFMMSRAAFPHMKKQGYGRVIMTASVAGIYGNFGQANYSAAKLGLVGLSNTLAIEGNKYNIHSNTIAPMGGTRMTEGILPPDLFNGMKPELIAPLVIYLCHDGCEESGGLFEAAGGWYGKYRWERTKGAVCRSTLDEMVSPETVKDNFEKICDFNDANHPASNAEATMALSMVLEDLRDNASKVAPNNVSASASASAVTGPLSAIGMTQAPQEFSYTWKDVALYNLGVGASTSESDYLKFLFEGNDEFCPLPTFIIVPSQDTMFGGEGGPLSNCKGWTIDFTKVLHGEQYCELYKPLETSGTLTSTATIVDVLDKGSGAVAIIDIMTRDKNGEKVAFTQWSTFVVGDGNFGGPRKSNVAVPLVDPPARAPDAVEEFKTSVDQAALYRLSGDRNPLHIDPTFAAMGGFAEPILHGLCSYGIAARIVLKHYANNDPTAFKAIKTRFAKPVLPGQTLITEMWKEGSRIFYKCTVKETGKPCLTGGYVDLVHDVPTVSESVSAAPQLASDAVFHEMASRVTPEMAAKVKAVFQWNITLDKKEAQTWTVDLKGNGAIYQGPPTGGAKADVILTLDDQDMVDMVTGKLNSQKAFMSGKLKVKGNVMLTTKLADLLKPSPKL